MYIYDKTHIDVKVFDFIYGCAMHDAILQKAFNSKNKEWVSKVTEAQDAVRAYIDRILSGEFKLDDNSAKVAHDEAFRKTALDVCKKINDAKSIYKDADGTFCFGNAQKLINMTVKHVYSHTYSIHTASLGSIRECFRHCHCPMDSIMLDKVWKRYKTEFNTSRPGTALGKNFKDPWGSEDFKSDENGNALLSDRYKKFQSTIEEILSKTKSDVFPIEYDYLVWKND
jgi:hypothetical protein